jgi:hypothetical protein
VGIIQPPTRWVLGGISQGVKRLGREVNHSSRNMAQVQNGGAIHSLHGAVLNELLSFTVGRAGPSFVSPVCRQPAILSVQK